MFLCIALPCQPRYGYTIGMDEILIGEKKYVSSKLAAKATGYAKDYIGQLCREGRVPARLVGRGWYVLESAIHDHRFGNPKNEPAEAVKPAAPVAPPIHSTWEAPRYEAADTEALPSVNRLNSKENEREAAQQRIEETWQAWFDRFDHVAEAVAPEAAPEETPVEPVAAEEPEKEPEEQPQEAEIEIEQDVKIPIRSIYQPQYQPSPEEMLPREAERPVHMTQEVRREGTGRELVKTIRLAGAIVAVIVASMAVFGSGYMDSYVISNNQMGAVAGVTIYNR